MSRVAPPRQHVGALQHPVGQAMVGLIEGRRADRGSTAQSLPQGAGDRLVHALRINGPYALIGPVMYVLAPHRHTHRSLAHNTLLSTPASRDAGPPSPRIGALVARHAPKHLLHKTRGRHAHLPA